MSDRLELLGAVVPARRDGVLAGRTARALLSSAGCGTTDTVVVVVDDGDNDGFDGGLPGDERLVVVRTDAHGPGHARTAGARAVAALAGRRGIAPGAAWVVSLDADVSLDDGFLPGWAATIAEQAGDVLGGPALFGPVAGEVPLHDDVLAASGWMWSDTSLYERFVGLVNLGGCNHAASLAAVAANGWYHQPTDRVDGAEVVVAGDDWDFGLRARMAGLEVVRVDGPAVVTSMRRIAADPVGFLAGRSYEAAFLPVRGAPGATSWPPEEPWVDVARRGRARLVAHFLLKPLLAGIEPAGELDWFLGPALSGELAGLRARAPGRRDGGWNDYRKALVALLFEPDVFGWCERVALRIAGADTP
ncbi:MAG: glycosyltransferase [Actinomycetota bacterium]|nr:glycosyltransferase [Actinomycetota bacterium]